MTTIRICKILLLAAVAFYFTLVAFNNLTDFDSNFQLVRHVLMMDSTFPGNHGMGRALREPWMHRAFYLGLIAWEILNAVLCWWGSISLLRALRSSQAEFQQAKQVGVVALTSSMLQWVCSIPVYRCGMVPDVAIEAVEWPGCSLQDGCE
jgi:predicted small integral membrane protein